MKKGVFVICLLMASVFAHAQFEEGRWIFNPSVTGLNFSHSDIDGGTRFGLLAQGGAFVVDNVALLITLGAEWSKPYDTRTAGVGGRYYFSKSGIYVGAGFKMKYWAFDGRRHNTTDFSLGAEAGYAYFISKNITIEPAIYYDLSFKDSDFSKFGIKVGFGIYF